MKIRRFVMAEKTVVREPCTRQRKRKVCSKCGLNLSHAAYIRHQNPKVFPGKVDPKRKCGTTAELPDDGEISEFRSDCEDTQETIDMDCNQNEESDESDESESETVEIVSDGESPDAAVDSTTEEEDLESNVDKQLLPSNQELLVVAAHICLLLVFFQLCYRVSERGITLLLNFLRAILSWVSLHFEQSDMLFQLRDLIPKNVYFLKKVFSSNQALHT